MAQDDRGDGGNISEEEQKFLLVRKHANRHRPNWRKALRATLITFSLLGVFFGAAVVYPGKLVAVLLGCSIVRAFVLFHDAAHGSLLATPWQNQVVAAMVGPWIARTGAGWSESHNRHHKVLGSDPPPFSFPMLSVAGLTIGQDDSRTVLFSKQEFDKWSTCQQVWAQIARDPFVFFGVLVPLQWPMRPSEWTGILGHLIIHAVAYQLGGASACWCLLEADWVALCIAGLLFHLQHQVNPGYWKTPDEGYSRDAACLDGSSFLLVPWWLRWVTLSIEYHHIHHLSSRIPCYELKACHESCDPKWLASVVQVSMSKAFRSCFHSMWDEKRKKYVSFGHHRLLGLED